MHFPSDSYLKYYEGAQLEDITLKPLSSMNRCCDTYLFGKRWDYGSVLYKHLDILFKMARFVVEKICIISIVINKFRIKLL